MGGDERATEPLVHAYFDVDLDVLLDIVEKDLPPLLEKIEALVR